MSGDITAPSGNVYTWTKSTPPTAEDWAAIQAFDKQQQSKVSSTIKNPLGNPKPLDLGGTPQFNTGLGGGVASPQSGVSDVGAGLSQSEANSPPTAATGVMSALPSTQAGVAEIGQGINPSAGISNPLGDNYQLPDQSDQSGSFTGITPKALSDTQNARQRDALQKSVQGVGLVDPNAADHQYQGPGFELIPQVLGAAGSAIDAINPLNPLGQNVGHMVGTSIGSQLDPNAALGMITSASLDPVGTLHGIKTSITNIWNDKDENGNPITDQQRVDGLVLLGTLAIGGVEAAGHVPEAFDAIKGKLKDAITTARNGSWSPTYDPILKLAVDQLKIPANDLAGALGDEGPKLVENATGEKVTGKPDIPAIAKQFGVDESAVHIDESGNIRVRKMADSREIPATEPVAITTNVSRETPPVAEPPVETPQVAETPKPEPPTPEPGATGLARQFADPEQIAAGKEPTPSEPVNVAELTEQGKTDVTSGAKDPQKILDEVTGPEGRNPTIDEVPALTYYKQTLRNELTDITKEINKGVDPARELGLNKRADAIDAELDRIEVAAQKARSQFHGYGQALQTAYNADYSQAGLSERAKAANSGDKLSESRQAQVDKSAEVIQEQQANMDAAKAEAQASAENPKGRGKVDKNALIEYIKKATGELAGKAEGGGLPSTKSGGIQIGSGPEIKLRDRIRALAKQYVQEGAKGLDGVLAKFHEDLPHLSEDHILDNLSAKYKKAGILRDAEKIKVNDAIKEIKKDANFRTKNTMGKGVQAAVETLNGATRTSKVALHLSGPFMQGKGFIFEDFPAWLKSWPEQIKGYKGGEQYAREQMATFQRSPLWQKAQQVGMDKVLAKQHGGASSVSEEFKAGLLDKQLNVKGVDVNPVSQINSRSSAAFNGFLNNARWEMFSRLARGNPDLTYLRDMTQHIAEMSGRSTSPRAIALTNALSPVAFSPRYTVSKYEFATLKSFRDASPKARVQIARLYGQNAVGTVAVGYMAAKMFNGSINLDPRDPKFGLVTIGNNEIDCFAGEAEPVRLLAKFIYGKSAKDTVENYLEGKATPLARLPFDMKDGQWTDDSNPDAPSRTKGVINPDPDSDKPNFSWWKEMQDMVEPITIQGSTQESAKGATLAPYLSPVGITTRAKKKAE